MIKRGNKYISYTKGGYRYKAVTVKALPTTELLTKL